MTLFLSSLGLPLKAKRNSSKFNISEPVLSINLQIKEASSFIIWRPHDDNTSKKSVVLTLLTPSYDGLLLKLRGRVAIVLAPFSKSFWRYFDITIYSEKNYFII